jgi:Na+/melibiose symporter-like transporter
MPVEHVSAPRALVERFLALMAPTPFGRLVRTHLVTMCADACVAVSLAGSIFFAKPSSGARGSVLLYLLVTMAPFAVVAPVIGPALDRLRGGRRLLVIVSCLGRAVLCLLMAQVITKPSPEGLLIYPFAFGILVLSKGYSVARSSLVPALVDNENELVRANSRLQLISLAAAAVGGAPAALVSLLFNADWSLRLATVVFVAAAVFATRIPRTEVVITADEAEREREELHQPSILLAGSAMALLRLAVGFVIVFAAFTLKSHVLAFGIVLGSSGAGNFAGNFLAPRLREHLREEWMLVGALLTCAAAALLGALLGSTVGLAIAALAIGVSASAGRLAFDSLLQRDGPDAVRGRAFARFETRFQAAWVVGALFGIIPVAVAAGLGVLGLVLAFGGLSYLAGLRAARTRPPRSKLRPEAVDRALGRARDNFRTRARQTSRARRQASAAARRARRAGTEEPKPAERGPTPPARAPRVPARSSAQSVPPPPRRRKKPGRAR